MAVNFDTPNAIVVNFLRFSGGNFIINVLSLSRHCCPQHAKFVQHLLTYPVDYQYRFNAIMETLPATKEAMIDWVNKYEFGNGKLYGKVSMQWLLGIQTTNHMNDIVNDLTSSPLHFFLTTHGGDVPVKNYLKVWPNARIILLINHKKFSDIARSLKSPLTELNDYAGNYCEKKYNELAGELWPTWHEFEKVGFNVTHLPKVDKQILKEMNTFYSWADISNQVLLFDIDNCIFDKEKFLDAVSNLYTQLEFDDFNSDLVGKFWQAYIDLHLDSPATL